MQNMTVASSKEHRITPPVKGDFSDRRVILVRPSEGLVGGSQEDDAAGFGQSWDSPTFVVIGCAASDEKLRLLADRFGDRCGGLAALIEFRRTGTRSAQHEVAFNEYLKVRWERMMKDDM